MLLFGDKERERNREIMIMREIRQRDIISEA